MNLPSIVRWAKDIILKRDETKDKGTITKITKAWQLSGIDSMGLLWVDAEKVHEILRTDRSGAKVAVQHIVPPKRQVVGGHTYLYGPDVLKVLSERVALAGNSKREDYLRISMELYHQIEFSDMAKLVRREKWEAMESARRDLKKNRIATLSLTADELTNDPLQNDAQFSHIRSYHSYPLLGLDMNNGLIVNKQTHAVITSHGVNDEAALYDLCKEQSWNEGWYDEYLKWLKEIGVSPVLK
jgi:hypothetical protein